MPELPQIAALCVDWCEVIASLTRAGLSTRVVGQAISVPSSTIHGWKMGAQPKHADGERLIWLWCQHSGQEREAVPIAT